MWSMHFIINFEISFLNIWNVLAFLLLTPEKNGSDMFLICYFLVINIYCFFDDHDTWLLLLEYFWWFIQVSAVFERLFKCYFTVPISLTRKFRDKKTHTHTRLFFFEKSWAKFFLKSFVFANLIYSFKVIQWS